MAKMPWITLPNDHYHDLVSKLIVSTRGSRVILIATLHVRMRQLQCFAEEYCIHAMIFGGKGECRVTPV